MTDLVARLREALDAHSAALDAYERHRTDGPHLNYAGQEPEAYDGYDSCYLCVATSAAMPFADVAFGRRMVAAHRKILDAWDANERELEANSAEFSRPARPMEDEAERFRRLGNAKAQGWELQGRRWALRLALTGLAEAYGVEA